MRRCRLTHAQTVKQKSTSGWDSVHAGTSCRSPGHAGFVAMAGNDVAALPLPKQSAFLS